MEGEQSDRIPGKGGRMTMTDTAAIRPAIPMSSPAPQISMSPLELDGYLTGIVVTGGPDPAATLDCASVGCGAHLR
jgi:hypothetical protein